ncbi:MAG: TusE/DsrC/DsvC family sulfur relay protein [Lysobacterales bacterium]
MTTGDLADAESKWAKLDLDDRGYLLHRSQWQPWVAEQMAQRDGLVLSEQHWEILDFLQDYYDSYQMAPPMRVLVKAIAIKLGEDKGESRYLYRLFPDGPAKQACRYAGLPKPVSCV